MLSCLVNFVEVDLIIEGDDVLTKRKIMSDTLCCRHGKCFLLNAFMMLTYMKKNLKHLE